MRAIVLAAAIVLFVAGCAAERREVGVDESVPDSFLVAFQTSAGEFRTIFHRAWSPLGVDRVHELARTDFYAGARIYRVNDRYAQFGYTGRPAIDSVWVADAIADEPPLESNVRGAVSFARGGPNTRSVILFINRGDNSNLDRMQWNGVLGFPPVGRVTRGMEVVDALYDGYGEEPMQWEDSIAAIGNAFLDRRFPLLDSIVSAEIVEDWR
jgi:peptidyl-prolyl cis-trans isomerase A (cyclophilin A)